MFEITREWVFNYQTEKGGWTQPQIEAIGESWPPTAGWIERVVGTRITDADRKIFESKITIRQLRRAS